MMMKEEIMTTLKIEEFTNTFPEFKILSLRAKVNAFKAKGSCGKHRPTCEVLLSENRFWEGATNFYCTHETADLLLSRSELIDNIYVVKVTKNEYTKPFFWLRVSIMQW